MKKKIEELLSGKFEYEQPQLLFSQDKITATLKAGETTRGSVYIGTEDDVKIRGYITSSDRRFVPGIDTFASTSVCLPYGIDAQGLNPGDAFKGWLCFTTNIGEYKLPFEVQIEKEEFPIDPAGFREVAKRDFREAHRLFTKKGFSGIFKDADKKEKALYAGLSVQPVSYQNVEEFLIARGDKEKVEISQKISGREFYEVKDSSLESFMIRRSGWGHLRLDIEARGSFLEVPKKVVTDEDFIGSHYQVEYMIKKEQLGSGNQFGEIIVKSPYQRLVYKILATKSAQVTVNMNIVEKKKRLELMRDYLQYCCGRKTFDAWMEESGQILNELEETGFDYPEYQLYKAYLLHLKGDDKAAGEILKRYQDKEFTKQDLEFAGIYLHLCTLTGLYSDKEQARKRIRNFFMQKSDSLWLFWVLLKSDPALKESPSRAVFMMEELFEKGCKSPFLYLEAWNYISGDMTLLHRLGSFWAQVFLFAGKQGLLTEELTMRFAYLSGYEKTFNESMYVALTKGYDRFPSDDTLEAICKYIMKGNPRRAEYFRWYSLAVDKGLRITRLYEYYVETMDLSYQRVLPKTLLMYFAYNNTTLGDARKAFIYASVVAQKDGEPQTYENYRESMEHFAKEKLAEGRINENYAMLYQEFLTNPQTKRDARKLAKKMFTCRLYCDDKKIRNVVVCHEQLKTEEIYPCVQGVAYPRIYTDDAVILFQDDQQRRYAATVDYNRKKLLDEREMLPAVLAQGVTEPGVLLHYCESVEIDSSNLAIFQQLVELDAFSDEYKEHIRKKILDYYASHVHGEELDELLEKMDYRRFASVDRTTLLEILISRGLYVQAMGIIEELGYEGLAMGSLLKLTSRMITRCDEEEDEELLALAAAVYRSGKYDEVILHYLMKYRFGPMDELLSLWKSAAGFNMDTYDLEEKILNLLMFAGDYRKEGENVLESYVKQSGKEKIIGAYLTQVAYGIFVREFSMSTFVRECLEKAIVQEWPIDEICSLAFFQALSKDKEENTEYLLKEKELLAKCMNKGMIFSFFKRLPSSMLEPYQLDDKTFVEYHADPKAKVTLFYALDTGLGLEPEYKSEPLKPVYQGICTKTFTLFYGETLHYYFQIEKDGETKKTIERVSTMNKVEGMPTSKYQLINQILSARRLDKKQEVLDRMEKYLQKDKYVKEIFALKRD